MVEWNTSEEASHATGVGVDVLSDGICAAWVAGFEIGCVGGRRGGSASTLGTLALFEYECET